MPGHAARRARPEAHRRRRLRDVVRQGPGRRSRRRRAQARQRLRLVAAGRRAGGRRRRPRLRQLVDAAPERPRDAGLEHAGAAPGQRRRVPRVRPVRLGAVALLGRVGRLQGDQRGGRVGHDGGPRRGAARLHAAGRLRAQGPRAAVDLHCRGRPAVARLEERLARQARRGARLRARQPLDKHIVASPRATLGIVTVGKAHFDFMEVLRRLALDPNALAAAGVRVYKVGWCFRSSRRGCSTSRTASTRSWSSRRRRRSSSARSRSCCTRCPTGSARASSARPTQRAGRCCRRSASCGRRASCAVVAEWLARLNPALDRRQRVVDFTMPALLSNEADAVKRQPYFCSGCPHNTSTKVPEGSRALAGIGCHFMASWMERGTSGLIQMGAEGVDWAAHSRFTRERHVFQNLGDGTYFHSGCWRSARPSRRREHHLQDPLQRRGRDDRRPAGGRPDRRARDRAPSRGRRREAHRRGQRRHRQVQRPATASSRAGTTFHDRAEIDAVQRTLREVDGVTLLIYDQTCAAEKRRRRKKGELAGPAAPRLHQRKRLRRLRRLRRGEQLPVA